MRRGGTTPGSACVPGDDGCTGSRRVFASDPQLKPGVGGPGSCGAPRVLSADFSGSLSLSPRKHEVSFFDLAGPDHSGQQPTVLPIYRVLPTPSDAGSHSGPGP